MNNYEQLIERISRASNLEKEDIERRVEAKRAKLSGLVSKEGAAQIVAAELGINFEKQKIKLNELGVAKRVNTSGKIIRLFPVREYKKENREGKIGSMIIADETGNSRVVMWDINHIKLIEDGKIKEGDVVDISGGSMRNSEIHLTAFSDIKLSQDKIENVKTAREFFEKRLSDTKIGEAIQLRAFIVQAFEPRFFEVCPECNGKVISDAEGSVCEKHGRVVPGKRALLNIVLDDGSGNVRAVLFSDQITQLGLNLEESFVLEKTKLLGKEMQFSGTMRLNKFFNNEEFFVSELGDINLDELIARLEKQ